MWGIARWQLMHEYAQKSTRTTLPRNDFRSTAVPSGGVQPRGDALDVRCGPAAFQLRAHRRCSSTIRRFCSVTRPPRFSFSPDLLVTADVFLQCARVVGDGPLQHRGQVEHQCHRQQDRDNACGDTDLALAAAERRDPFGDTTARKGEEQQRQRRADRERQRQRYRRQPDRARRPGDHDRRQHRPRARHIEHAQREAQPETAVAGAELLLRQPGERLLQQCLELREDQADPDRHQRHECHPADGVLRQAQQRQQRRTGKGDNGKAQHESADHPVRPQRLATVMAWSPRRWCRPCASARGALGTGEEDHRKDGKDARRYPGDQATDESR